MNDIYDSVVIGNNPANFIGAALLGKNNLKVHYIGIGDNEDFTIGNFAFNGRFPICDCFFDDKPGIFSIIIDRIGYSPSLLDEGSTNVKINMGNFDIEFPLSMWQYEKKLMETFSNEPGLTKYFETINKLNDEWMTMVRSDSFPGIKAIPTILRYSKTSHVQFVEDLIHDPKLKKILCFFDVTKTSSVVNMAGYINQIFNSKELLNGYEELQFYLHQQIRDKEYVSSLEELIYRYNEESKLFEIWVNDAFIRSRTLVISHDIKGVFKDVKDDIILDRVVHINYYLKDIVKHYNKELELRWLSSGDKIIIRKTSHSNASFVQVDVSSVNDLDDSLKREIDELVLQNGQIQKMNFITAKDRKNKLYWEEKSVNDWDYNIGDLKKNPLYSNDKPDGIFYTGKWGKAFFTAAEVTKNNVIKYLNCNK